MEAAFVEIGLEKNGFLYVDEIVGPELEGRKGAQEDPGSDQARPDRARPGGEGSDEVEGRAADDRDLAARPLPRLRPERRGLRRLAPARGRGAHAAQGDRQDARPEGRRDHRAHGCRGRVGRGHRARPRVPPAALEDDPDEGEGRDGTRARLRGGRAAAADRARPLRGRLRRRADRRRPHVSAHRQLPQEDVAAHGRARRTATARRSRSSRPRASMPRSARRSTAVSISRRAATSSSTTRRPSRSSTSTPVASSARAGRARRAVSRTRSSRTTSRP